MSSLDCAATRALDNFEACVTSSLSCSFSRICHRTRSKLANREATNVVGEDNTDADHQIYEDLNLVPLNGCQPWKTGNDKMCRRCYQWTETLPHVINHCGVHSHTWQLRHNAIVERVLKAISPKASILSVNQNVCGTTLTEDIVAQVGKKVLLIDITCPFEGGTAFTAAWEAKCSKYEPRIPLYQVQGLTASVVPFLVEYLKMLYSFLEDRKVSLGDVEHTYNNKGIPQGSCLDPILWNIFINDILELDLGRMPTYKLLQRRCQIDPQLFKSSKP
ncbi:reverse transcriptase domain-containing protein [Caerostris darwini]|uniref:Reverse transcriptase domain-containing protein n=1 Tax=Caerostris darwini TaxID=1538125 RepID=A0AAV4RQ35_9ARAC|nr:reverse transcriptase domain-containing protein [Caerostris darwini]